MQNKLNFDAARYCRNNAGRMGKWMEGEDIAGMIADEVEKLRARVARLEEALKEIDDKDTYSAKSYGPFAQIARRALEER